MKRVIIITLLFLLLAPLLSIAQKTVTVTVIPGDVPDRDIPEGNVLESDVPESYIIKDGDTLWEIAERLLGNPFAWTLIRDNNISIENPHWIYPGSKLILKRLPEKPAEDEPLEDITQDTEKNKEERIAKTQKFLESLFGEVEKEVEQEKKTQEQREPALEIDGLIINETKTKIGEDFYNFFYNLWAAPDGVENYTIYIVEKPLGAMGSWIWIKVNDTFVYRNRHKPNDFEIETGAKHGITIVGQYLFRRENDERQLSGQDMSGTGIY